MEIKRDFYLNKLIHSMNDGFIKIVTGLRRSGKTYLLETIFRNYLLSIGIKEDHIIYLNLENYENRKYLDKDVLFNYINSLIVDSDMHYLILDEIQKIDDFEPLLISFLNRDNIDVYVTGSNSKFLSRDIKTEFRGRGKEIMLNPLSFSEFYVFKNNLDFESAINEYCRYGGLPLVVLEDDEQEKINLLESVFKTTYELDLFERFSITRKDVLNDLLDIISSDVGSLTSPTNIYNSYQNKGDKKISLNTIIRYLDYLEYAFLITKVDRLNISTKRNVNTPNKYYFSDNGLRNYRLSFMDVNIAHILENVIYNEMIIRGYHVSTGYLPTRKNGEFKELEVDFICTKGGDKYYIQVAQNIGSEKTRDRELRALEAISDSFKKILIVKDGVLTGKTDKGILVISLKDFLLNPNSENS